MFLTPVFATHPRPPGGVSCQSNPDGRTPRFRDHEASHSGRSSLRAEPSNRSRIRVSAAQFVSPLSISTVGCQLSPLEYRIGVQPNDRPASIEPLQNGDAADSRRFWFARHCRSESLRQTCHRTSRRSSRRFSGSALGSSPAACGAAHRRTTTADRSSLARARSKHFVATRQCRRSGNRRRCGNGQALVFQTIFYSQRIDRREYSRVARSSSRQFRGADERLLGVFHEFALRELQAGIPDRPGKAGQGLRLSLAETSHGWEPLQPHGIRPAQNEQSSGECLGARSDCARIRSAPAPRNRTQGGRQKHPRGEIGIAFEFSARLKFSGTACLPKFAEFNGPVRRGKRRVS